MSNQGNSSTDHELPQNRFQTMTKRLLFLIGGSTALAIVPLFLSTESMRSLHSQLGLGVASQQPIFEYMARSLCVLYFTHGLIVLRVAVDFERLSCMVPVLAGSNLCIGACLFIVDWKAGMPTLWMLCEGPPILLINALLLWCYRRSGLMTRSTYSRSS